MGGVATNLAFDGEVKKCLRVCARHAFYECGDILWRKQSEFINTACDVFCRSKIAPYFISTIEIGDVPIPIPLGFNYSRFGLSEGTEADEVGRAIGRYFCKLPPDGIRALGPEGGVVNLPAKVEGHKSSARVMEIEGNGKKSRYLVYAALTVGGIALIAFGGYLLLGAGALKLAGGTAVVGAAVFASGR